MKRGLIIKLTGMLLFFAGLFILSSSKYGITGAFAGVSGLNFYNLHTFIGILFILCAAILFLSRAEPARKLEEEEEVSDAESSLEKKLSQIKDARIRRELLSDMHRAEKFAEKGIDVNGLWDPDKNYEENRYAFFNEFYDNVDYEITTSYWKSKHKDIPFRDYLKNIKKYTGTEDFAKFREKALKMITLWNEKVLSSEFVPLFIEESNNPPKDFPDMKMRCVYYGLPELKGKSRTYYNNSKENGDVIVAHEIINPDAVENPDRLNKIPHIHWELEYIMKKNFKFK